MKTNIIYQGDCLEVMKTFQGGCIDMCMTSPPYWGLRDYGTGEDQLGLEPTPELYIEHMTTIFHEVKRVLKKEGTLWLNVGDTYSGSGGDHKEWHKNDAGFQGNLMRGCQPKKVEDIKPKCLCMIPERLAWSLIKDGWILRNKIIWYKPNSMPSSVTDRFSNKYEFIYLFSQQQKYYFDLDAIRVECLDQDRLSRRFLNPETKKKVEYGKHGKVSRLNPKTAEASRMKLIEMGKNPGDVFSIPTQPMPEAHFAVFPEGLCETPIKAGCPEGGIVLDPFSGAGTALFVAKELRRNYIGIEINPDYIKISEERLRQKVFDFPL